MALSGETPEAVTKSVSNMRTQQDFVFKVGGVSITSLFLSAIVLSWARRPRGVAILNTIVYMGVYYLMVTEGRKAYLLFASIKEEVGAYEERSGKGNSPALSRAKSDVNPMVTAAHDGVMSDNMSAVGSGENDQTAEQGTQTRARGALWMRQSLSKGGELQLCYAVLEKGKLDIYRKESDFVNHENPINQRPFQLWKYRLELDPRKFNRGLTSASKSLRKLATGQGEFSITQLATSDYDLKEAVHKYRFILYPKVLSELTPLATGEFMANDEQSYKLWIKALSRVIRSYEHIEANPTVEATMRANANVELAVNAASRSS
eukprot:CAMPEP_0185025428 /NCGR_PEP_ID=MMETSP1103-20130426/8390_1 /TAXON_ID=36769 /ORGANISM="Paraphysomonas bandaiensis, Strain Caron Lab Isolate" /LENGTH=318 /DNA_ID=CAMNT_0027558627 /DNA_START=310 /DNA_END=1266 /DNA_ORIENTATION=-